MQQWAAEYWVSLGVPRHKMVIGMATYGRCFTLADVDNATIGAPAVGPCKRGTFTQDAGFLAYYEV